MVTARFLKRPPADTVEALRARWRTAAAELRVEHPRVGVAASWATDASYGKREPVFDGVVTLWPRDTDPAPAWPRTPDEDVALALDVNEEVVVKDALVPPGALQFVGFATIPAAWSRDAWHHHWRAVHGPLAARNPYVLRYVQYHTRDDVRLADGRSIGGFAFVWFADMGALRASATSPEYEAVGEDERTFIEGRPAFFIAEQDEAAE